MAVATSHAVARADCRGSWQELHEQHPVVPAGASRSHPGLAPCQLIPTLNAWCSCEARDAIVCGGFVSRAIGLIPTLQCAVIIEESPPYLFHDAPFVTYGGRDLISENAGSRNGRDNGWAVPDWYLYPAIWVIWAVL